MESRRNFAVFVDLENAGSKASTLNSVIEKVKIKGNILIGRVYGYSDRFQNLREVILSNTFSAVPGLRFGGSLKNSMDIQLVVDALDVAYGNDLIDCFCIVSGDSDFTPLVGKLKSMGKYVLGISRSEIASKLFINACTEFSFLESVSAKSDERGTEPNGVSSSEELNALVVKILREQEMDSDGMLYASELKKALSRLRPDFSEKNYGFSSFSKLMNNMQKKYSQIEVKESNNNVKVGLRLDKRRNTPALSQDSWLDEFKTALQALKKDGFDRVNPSIIKDRIMLQYNDFDERSIGFKKFSDLLRELERQGLVRVELDESRSMLVAIK